VKRRRPRSDGPRRAEPLAVWLEPAELEALTASGTTAYRIFSGDHAWIERFGDTAMVSVKERADADALLDELAEWEQQAGVSLGRVFLRVLVRQPREKDQPVLVRGEAGAEPSEIVQESGLSYAVDFDAGYSVGLFCDQRHNRLRLRALAPQRVLNTFAYTCAFSVAAAREGAETLNIDLSKSSLQRGRRNFTLNGLDPTAHRFLADDVLDVLPRLAVRGETFDAIILDPPTFGRSSPKKAFRAERDYEDLIAAAVAVAAPKAHLLLSTNCSSLDAERLGRMAGRVTGGRAVFHREPNQADIPARHAASTLWMQRR
jgi:23S rRNA (cytosine1962-C5)-methyltransferase